MHRVLLRKQLICYLPQAAKTISLLRSCDAGYGSGLAWSGQTIAGSNVTNFEPRPCKNRGTVYGRACRWCRTNDKSFCSEHINDMCVPGRTCGHVWRGFAEVGLGASAGFAWQSCAQLWQASCEGFAEAPRRIPPEGPPMYLLCQLWPKQDSGGGFKVAHF
ncbi:hypothetical protein B0H14DRAFT_2578882 [Mycena olivaceomarginata]|nr:hypothetical protein B0H14DRAFT_2578882 [Mycena olivaceomarginata]